MTEQLVSFETAKAAKEKGFNWKVIYGYTSKGNLTNIVQTDGLIPNFISQFEDLNKYVITEQDIADGENTDNWVIYSAPSQSLLQKWLRDTFEINVFIDITSIDSEDFVYIYHIKYLPKEFSVKKKKMTYYKHLASFSQYSNGTYSNGWYTYEDCLENALSYVLTTIKN